MPVIRIRCQISLSDYRKASYYGLFLRHRVPLLIFFGVLLVSILYAVGAAAGLGKANPFVFLLAGAYLVWALFLFAGNEKQIRSYLQRDDCLLGVELQLRLDEKTLQMEIPSREIRFTRSWSRLAAAFELSELFMFYLDAQEVYLLPKRFLRSEETEALRQVLKKQLKDRFSSRWPVSDSSAGTRSE